MTYTIRKSVVEPADAVAFLRERPGFTPERHSVTVETSGNMTTVNGVPPQGVAPYFVRDFVALSIAGNTIDLDNLNQFRTLKAGWLNGAELDVRRVVSGSLVEVATHSILSAVVRPAATVLHGTKDATAAGGVFRYAFPNYTQPSVPVFYFIAERTTDGRRSPWSASLSTTIAAAPSDTITLTNTVTTLATALTGAVDPALTTPTGGSVTTEDSGKTFAITVPNVAGKTYIVGTSFYDNPDRIGAITIADASDVQTTDMLLVRQTFDHTLAKQDVISPRVWTASSVLNSFGLRGFAQFNEDVAWGSFEFKDDADGRYVRITVNSGKTANYALYSHSGSGQSGDYYPEPQAGDSYFLRTTMRSVGAATVQPAMQDASSLGSVPLTASFVDREHIFNFTATPSTSSPRTTGVTLTGPCVVDIKYFLIGKSGTDPLMYSDADAANLANAQPEFVRFHHGVKTKPYTYSVRDYLSFYGTAGTNFNSLPQSLRMLKAVNDKALELGKLPISPWLQIPWHFTEADYDAVAQYFYTPFVIGTDTKEGKPWAYLRAVEHGQVASWSDVFPSIRLEAENENWNPLTGFYNLPNVSGLSGGTINGKSLDRMAERFMLAAGYEASKASYYLGLWASNQVWNTDSIASSVHADVAGYADYNGGWDSGLTEAVGVSPEGYQSSVAHSYVVTNSGLDRKGRAQRLAADCAVASVGRDKPLYAVHYESGPGYVLNGLNGASVSDVQAAAQQLVMNSLSVGTATLQSFLSNAANGVRGNNFFTFGNGNYWKTHSKKSAGGAAYPSWQWVEFYNDHLIGETVELDIDKVSRMEADGFEDNSALSAFAVRKAGSVYIVLCNLDVFSSHDVKARFTDVPTGGGIRYHMPGGYTDTNRTLETKDDLDIVSEDMPSGFATGGVIAETLAPGQCSVYHLTI
jgi:hypothetical protein